MYVGVHELLGDVDKSTAEAFDEKNLEELVLKGSFGLFVYDLVLVCLAASD